METARIRAFMEAAERGSVKAAAEKLGYTSSAISQLITSLEKELDLTLFTRSQKGVKLTAEGEALIPLARTYLADEAEIYHFASELKGLTTGRITIATYTSVATTWLPEIVRNFKNDYPGIQINILECIYADIISHFEKNEADLAFMGYNDGFPYDWIPLREVPIVAAVPEDHRFADRKAFPVSECMDDDFIMGSLGKEPEILNVFDRNNVHPEIRYTTYDTPSTLAMVRMGLGISFVNELSAEHWNEHLVKMPLDPPQVLTFGMAIPDANNMTLAARKFRDYTVDWFENGGDR